MKRTSTRIGRVPPTRKNSPSSITLSSLAWSSGGISAISSRKSVPVSATSRSPRLAATAPVKAPFSWPKSSLASSSSVKTAQLSARNGRSRRGLVSWISRATSPLPTPLSPVSSTLQSEPRMLSMVSAILRNAGLLAMKECRAHPEGSLQRVVVGLKSFFFRDPAGP